MTEDAGPDRVDNFRACCPWLMLTRTVRLAVSPQILLLAALGALGTTAGWRVVDRLLLTENDKAENRRIATDARYFGAWPGQRLGPVCPFVMGEESATSFDRLGVPPADPVLTIPYRIVAPLIQLVNRSLTWRQLGYYLLGGLWTLLVWSLFGGAITRLAALWFGRDDARA